MSSRSEALKAIVRKFDGFDVREEWDVAERIEATLQACGYMDLFEVILDAVTENNHLHFADECRKGSKRIRSARQAKNVSDRRAGELAAERDVLAAIVRDLADDEPSVLDDWHEQRECGCCHARCAPTDELHHDDDCAYHRACAWLASQEPKT